MPISERLQRFKLRYNVYAIRNESGVTLFDCGSADSVEALKSVLQTDQIRQVLLTHGHSDHAGSGNYWLKHGAKIFAHEDECSMLCYGGPRNAPKAFKYIGFEPTGVLTNGARIAVGGEFDFVLLHTPGHTSGSACYFDERNDILLCGDLLFGPIWGQMITFLLEFLTSYRQSNDYLRRQIESLYNLEKFGAIKSTTLVLPGHGPEFYLREKPGAIKRTLRLLRFCLAF